MAQLDWKVDGLHGGVVGSTVDGKALHQVSLLYLAALILVSVKQARSYQYSRQILYYARAAQTLLYSRLMHQDTEH